MCLTCFLLKEMLFIFALDSAIRRVQVNLEGLKVNGIRQILVNADVNVLGGSLHTIKKNTEALVVVTRRLYIQLCVLQASVLVMQVKRTITITVYTTVLLKMNPWVRNM